MKNPQVSTKTFCLSILFVIAISNPTFAQQPSASVGGKCAKVGLKSGISATPLVCEKAGNKLKWVRAPGGKCSKADTLGGTVKQPWVCKKVSGKLKWVATNTSTASTTLTTTTTPVKTTNASTSAAVPRSMTTAVPSNDGGSSEGKTVSAATTTTTSSTTIPVVCANSANVLAEIASDSDGTLRRVLSGGSATNYYTRSVQGVIRNRSGVSVSVVLFSLSGNIWYGSTLEKSQTVSVGTNISIAAGGVYGWSKTYEALGHPDYQYVVPGEISRNETIKTFTFVSTDIRCP